jgi:DNA-binding CsgD family transcriptional regulator
VPVRAAAAAAPATGWASLTDAERRVATLISEGHTNKSAASALGVSINTVGTHLRALFAKLGVQSCVQLANYLASYASEVPVDSMRRQALSLRAAGPTSSNRRRCSIGGVAHSGLMARPPA